MDTMKGEKLKESESRSTVFVKTKKEKGLESTQWVEACRVPMDLQTWKQCGHDMKSYRASLYLALAPRNQLPYDSPPGLDVL